MADFYLPKVTIPPEDATIAQRILTATADMRRAGTFSDGTVLCWSPAELEKLAMFAIGAKHELAKLRAPIRRRRSKSEGR